MGFEKEIKNFIVGSATEKNSMGDYTVISFSEQEVEDDPFYKVTVVKNSAVVKSKIFSVREFDIANDYFGALQVEYLGSVKKNLDFNEWTQL